MLEAVYADWVRVSGYRNELIAKSLFLQSESISSHSLVCVCVMTHDCSIVSAIVWRDST